MGSDCAYILVAPKWQKTITVTAAQLVSGVIGSAEFWVKGLALGLGVLLYYLEAETLEISRFGNNLEMQV